MLELSTTQYEPTDELYRKLYGAKALNSSLDNKDDRIFQVGLRADRPAFPSTHAKYNQLKNAPLKKLSEAQVTQLKESLESDIVPLVAQALTDAGEAKTMFGETLPVDLQACLGKLSDIKASKKEQIQKLQEELEELDAAQALLELMQMNERIAEELSSNKRQRV